VDVALQRISRTTLTDRVYASLRERLLGGWPAPGEFIREEEVSTALGVSRTPVREAMARLAREGFLERLSRRGFRVPTESVQQLLELYPIVCALELLASEAAFPKLTPEDLKLLREINREAIEVIERGDSRLAIELNDRFHHVLSEKCGNERLCTLLDELRGQVVRLELWSANHAAHTSEALRQHDEIIDAVEARRYDDALTVLKLNRLQTYTAFNDEVPKPAASDALPPAAGTVKRSA
jgi:DNA-binding GntR family transcriptional regulator